MGRNYRTAKPTFVDDNIYTPPWELASKVIDNIDSDIEENETNLLSLSGQLEASSLQADQPRVKEIISGYESQIEELAKKIQKNPLEFRRDSGTIRNLGKDIHENWTRGEVSAIQGNKVSYDSWVKDHIEKTKATKGYVTQEDMNFAKQKFISEFGGTKYDKGTGTHDSIYTEDLNPYVDIEDLAEERGEGYIASSVKNLGAEIKNGYIYKSKGSSEFVKYGDIQEGVMSAMMNDRELMSYYAQQIRLGSMTEDQALSTLSNAADRVATKYSFNKSESGTYSLSADPYALEKVRQTNKKNLHKYKEDLKNPEKISYTERTTQPLDATEFTSFMNSTPKAFKKSFEIAKNKLNSLKERGVGETDPQYIEAKKEVDSAELDYLNREQYGIEREQDFLKQVFMTYGGANSSQYKLAKELGWYGIYQIKEKSIKKTFQGGKTAGATRKVVTNSNELELKEFHANFKNKWAKNYADSHTSTDWYINTASKKSNYYKGLAEEMLKTGNVQYLDSKGNPITDMQIETGIFDTSVSGNSVLEGLMNKIGTTKVSDIIDVQAIRMDGSESGVIKAFLTTKAKEAMDISPEGEITIKITGTNLPEVAHQHAKLKGHNLDPQGNTEDAWLPMDKPSYNNFVNQVQAIPSQPEFFTSGRPFADPDKSFGKVLFTGDSKIKVTNTGVDADGNPMYVFENIDTGYIPKDSGNNIKTYTLQEVAGILDNINTSYHQEVIKNQ